MKIILHGKLINNEPIKSVSIEHFPFVCGDHTRFREISVLMPSGVWTFPICGPKWPKKHSQGLPWVSQDKRSVLKGLECALDPAERFGAAARRA